MPRVDAQRIFASTSRYLAAGAVVYATVMAIVFLQGDAPRHRAETAWFLAGGLATLALAGAAASDRTPASGTGDAGDEHDRGRWRWTSTATLAAFIAASVALYAPILGIGLLSDDFVLIDRVRAGHLTMDGAFFRPLPLGVWRVALAAGADASTLHGINVAIHGLSSWLVYELGRSLGLQRWAIAAAVLFLASPASVEAVAWLSALFDVAMVAATLGYILAVLHQRKITSAICLAAALLSKETGVVAAGLGLGVAAIAGTPLRLPAVGALAGALWTVVRLLVLPIPEGYAATPSRYFVKELVSRAFGSIGLPWTTGDIEAGQILVMFPWFIVSWVLCIALLNRLPRRTIVLVFFLAFWIIASVVPAYSFFYVAPNLEGSRYVYLGTAAFGLFVGTLASAVKAGRLQLATAVLITASAVFGSWGVVTHERDWQAAARERDTVLQAVKAVFAENTCRPIALTRLPDTHRGAYVFRNGLAQALAENGIGGDSIAAENAECTYRWTGDAFRAERSPVPR